MTDESLLAERALDTPEARLNYMAGPASGPPLLFLHGVTRRWQDFLPLFPPLLCRWQIHGLDFRGHGASGRSSLYHVVDFVRDARAMVEAVLREPAVIYGHSLGALVAAAVAAELPGSVRALVLEDPPAARLIAGIRETPFAKLFAGMKPLAGRERSVAALTRALADLPLSPPESSKLVRLGDLRDATSLRFSARCLQDLDPEVLTSLLEGQWLEGLDLNRVLAGVRCPVLLLCADTMAGGMLGGPAAREMAQLIADCTLIELPGVGHLIHWLETERTLRLLLGFLESV